MSAFVPPTDRPAKRGELRAQLAAAAGRRWENAHTVEMVLSLRTLAEATSNIERRAMLTATADRLEHLDRLISIASDANVFVTEVRSTSSDLDAVVVDVALAELVPARRVAAGELVSTAPWDMTGRALFQRVNSISRAGEPGARVFHVAQTVSAGAEAICVGDAHQVWRIDDRVEYDAAELGHVITPGPHSDASGYLCSCGHRASEGYMRHLLAVVEAHLVAVGHEHGHDPIKSYGGASACSCGWNTAGTELSPFLEHLRGVTP